MKLLNKIGLVTFFSLFFAMQVHALDNPKYTPTAGNNLKGTLSLDQLYIGGVKSHKNVNIEFDFSNSTFVLLGATPADNRIPEQAFETHDAGQLSVGLRGCVSKNKSVTCHLLLTSNEFDRTIKMCGASSYYCYSKSTAFDNKGNQYFPSIITIANFEGVSQLEQKLVAGLTTEATIVFDNLSTLAVNFPQLDLGFVVDKKVYRVKFDKVAF
jgi:hypothetical protein